jgi:hypothetical protein
MAQAASTPFDHTQFRRTADRYYRLDRQTHRVETAFVIARQDGSVLYNVEAANGDRFKHRYLDEAEFERRWFEPEATTAIAAALQKAAA